jgi:hypothetical protein
VDLVLDKQRNHWNQSAKESEAKELSVLLRFGVLGSRHHGASDVRDCAEQIYNHGNIVDKVIVRRCDINPSTASYSPDEVVDEEELCKALGSIDRDIAHGQEIPKVAQHQTRS